MLDSSQPYRMWEVDPPLSLLDLVANGTLDLKIAALLWLAVERKASIVSAAGPRLAGKTTLLVALREMTPSWLSLVYTRGVEEDFSFVKDTKPERTYIMVNEISEHLPAYLSGWRVQKVFELLGQGYSMMATIHADTPEELFSQLIEPPHQVPALHLNYLQLVVFLGFAPYRRDSRRVRSVHLVTPASSARVPSTVELMRWEPSSDSYVHVHDAKSLSAVAKRLGMKGVKELSTALEKRQGFLQQMFERGDTGVGTLRRQVLLFYERHVRPGM